MKLKHYLQLAKRLRAANDAAIEAWDACKARTSYRPCPEARALYLARLKRCDRLQSVLRECPPLV